MNIGSIILKTAACLSILLPMHLNAATMIPVSPKTVSVTTVKDMPGKLGGTGFKVSCTYDIGYDKEKAENNMCKFTAKVKSFQDKPDIIITHSWYLFWANKNTACCPQGRAAWNLIADRLAPHELRHQRACVNFVRSEQTTVENNIKNISVEKKGKELSDVQNDLINDLKKKINMVLSNMEKKHSIVQKPVDQECLDHDLNTGACTCR